MEQIHIDSSLRNTSYFPNINSFSVNLRQTLKKETKLKLIGGIFENNTVSTYYKIVIKECMPMVDGNIGLAYSFIIQNNVNGSYLYLDE